MERPRPDSTVADSSVPYTRIVQYGASSGSPPITAIIDILSDVHRRSPR
jgi:hypothetical protein